MNLRHTFPVLRVLALLSSLACCTFAATPPPPPAPNLAPESEFTPMFNGTNLAGWEGKPAWWRVEDGAITSESTAARPCTNAHYLMWRGDRPADFELRLDYKLIGGNSGVQFRSEERPEWDTYGYQADMESGDQWTGCLFEHRRGGVAMRGERVVIQPDGTRTVNSIGDATNLLKVVRSNDWNSYRILARGPTIVLEINGTVMCRATDLIPNAATNGVIALQMHPGPPMKVQFRNLRIRKLAPLPSGLPPGPSH